MDTTKAIKVITVFIILSFIACATPSGNQNSSMRRSPSYFVQEGIKNTSIGNYKSALQNFNEAAKLDANYQPAYLWMGIAYVNLGNGTEAVRYFDRAITIAPQSGEAETARMWKTRLKDPLTIAITSFYIASGKGSGSGGEQALESLYKKLYASGLYKISSLHNMSEGRNARGDIAKMCDAASSNGAKILMTGLVNTMDVEEYSLGILNIGPVAVEIPLELQNQKQERRYKVAASVTIQIYSTKNAYLEGTFTESCEAKKFKSPDEGISAIFDCISDKLIADINKTLM